MIIKMVTEFKLIVVQFAILVPRAHDPSGLWQGSRALAGPDFLSMRRAFVSYSRPIRFDGKSVNRRLPVLDQARAIDPCHRPEGSWALGTRMPVCTPKRCRSVHARGFTAGQKSCGKSGLGHLAAGPSRATGLLLAKPHSDGVVVNCFKSLLAVP